MSQRVSPSSLTPARMRDGVATVAVYAVVVVFAYLVYRLFEPFLVPLAWAAVLVICFHPVHERFERRLTRPWAALASTVAVALVVIVPMIAVGSAFVTEAMAMARRVPNDSSPLAETGMRWLQRLLISVPGGQNVDAAALFESAAARLTTFLSSEAAMMLQNVALFVVYLVMTLFAMFFLFRDGAAFMRTVRRLLPVDPALREKLFEQVRLMVNASVTAALVVAAVQGALGGLAFWVLGLPAPVFWGVVMAMACVVPLGAWTVWGPAALWLVLTGQIGRGLVLAGIGLALVSGVDNILRPALLSGRSRMNGLLLFVSLFGGVMAFGFVGLVLGPVLMATGVALVEAYTAAPATPRSTRFPAA
jgi:predicted PurR-regulated permease PerM